MILTNTGFPGTPIEVRPVPSRQWHASIAGKDIISELVRDPNMRIGIVDTQAAINIGRSILHWIYDEITGAGVGAE